MTEYIVIYVTVGKKEDAERIAEALVEGKLAACVNIISNVRSIYSWKAQTCRDDELLLIIKSRKELFRDLEAAVRALHPYEVPVIISLPVLEGHAPYLNWLRDVTGG